MYSEMLQYSIANTALSPLTKYEFPQFTRKASMAGYEEPRFFLILQCSRHSKLLLLTTRERTSRNH